MFQTPVAVPDSIPSPVEEIKSLKALSFDEFVDKIVSDLTHFAISLAVAILVFYVGRFIIRKLYAFVEKILHKRNIETSLTTFVLSLINIVLYFILIVTVIGILGIETSSFIALFASAGVAIGMALSGTLQNFAGGVLILLLKPYKVGDYIEAQGFSGTVKTIEIFNTVLTTADNKSIIIPNGSLSTGSINNYSKQNYRRVDWTISVSYGDDFPKAKAAIEKMLKEDDRVLFTGEDVTSAPAIYLSALGASSVDITVRAWVRSENYWGVFFDFNERFYARLEKEGGVNFPFPQIDVHMK